MTAVPKVSVVMPVLIRHEWQYHMTVCAIRTLFATTATPFELVVVETGEKPWLKRYLQDDVDVAEGQYIHLPKGKSCNHDANVGFDAAEGEYLVYTGNDVFTRPGWLEALLEVFQARADAGAATLASNDLRAVGAIAQFFGSRTIMEGIYGPFMMFRKGWSFDADSFPTQFGDTDLIMRLYRDGKRMYRNNAVVIEHLNKQTVSDAGDHAGFQAAKDRFVRKHDGCGILMYRLMLDGIIL